eukprot:CAMPEP_0170308236 /NCGR_PEP_ID=MMETSP0116_2-20130129/54552_1 /TAXON_ID=400756 /ORGANISM="Durinskia baltica, Strain CSIRO CS-38" /LENGTH=78 /DNA_ID=CAMNT_0010560407 /DNA_START=11 /DNA_END=243 /DNA_ORIENTATION=-
MKDGTSFKIDVGGSESAEGKPVAAAPGEVVEVPARNTTKPPADDSADAYDASQESRPLPPLVPRSPHQAEQPSPPEAG